MYRQVPLFYEPQMPLEAGGLYPLSRDAARHALQVLRLRAHEAVQVTNGRGGWALGHLAAAGKKEAMVQILTVEQELPLQRRLCMAVGMLKNAARTEWILEKLTELGVAEIALVRTDRVEKSYPKADRWHQIVVSALQQSQQAWLPTLHLGASAVEVMQQWAAMPHKWLAHCATDTERKPLAHQAWPAGDAALFIGPEGDFSASEIAMAKQLGYQTVALGSTRLRSETAALVAAALVLNR